MLALAIGSVPAAFAADPTPTVKTIVSGTAPVTYSIPSTGASGPAVVVSPNAAYSTIPSTQWINTTGLTGCDQACNTTAIYSTTFALPAVSSASIKVEILADNSAVSIALNGSSIGGQTDGDIYANFQTVSTYQPLTATFLVGTNTLTIQNRDYGVADGIDFRVTVTYTPVPIVVSFVTPASKPADGNADAAITLCSVAPSTTGLTCAAAAGAFADFDNAEAGDGKPVTAQPTDFVLSGPLVEEYTQRSLTGTTATIRPGPVASLAFSAQPIDTEVGTPIYSDCVGVSTGDPCALAPTSSPVTVTARDAFQNLAGPGAPGAPAGEPAVNITIRDGGTAGTLLTSATGVPTSVGVATFGNDLEINVARTSTVLYAKTGPTISASSSAFQVVSDLEACLGLTCDNKAASGGSTTQTTFGKIKSANDDFANTVTLTTQFLSDVVDINPDANQCTNSTNSPALGQMTEVKVQGGGVSATQPDFTMVLIYPKKTLQAEGFSSRGTDKFNVCLGATWLDTGTATPWRAKTSLTNSALTNSQEVVADSKVYWGWAPDCASLTETQRLTNPCISLRTKQVATLKAQLVPSVMTTQEFNALGMKDSDISIVISKPWPWDGKGIVR